MLETNKRQRSVLQHWGGRGLTIEEKCVFIQQKSIIVSLKALVWQNVSTFVHDCSLGNWYNLRNPIFQNHNGTETVLSY